MGIFIVLLFMVGFGWATGSIAGSRGRDRGAWTLLGAFFGVIALIAACAITDQRSLEQLEYKL
jgi:hypothetical protein